MQHLGDVCFGGKILLKRISENGVGGHGLNSVGGLLCTW
jgi:hypothetical protein